MTEAVAHAPDLATRRLWPRCYTADGIIRFVDKQVNVERAGQDIARRLAELGVPRRSP